MIDISFKNRTGLKPDLLSAVIGADSFFYGLFTKDNELLECQLYPVDSFDNKELISKIKQDIYSTDGLDVRVCYSGKPYLHSQKEDAGQLVNYFPAFQNKSNFEDQLTDQNIVVDYGQTKDQTAFLKEVLGETHSEYHISTVLANYYYPYSSDKLVALIDKGKLHMMYANDQSFKYYNQFVCEHENDYLYFVMMAFKELGLDPKTTTLELSGRMDTESPIYKMLRGYVQNVELSTSSILDVKDLRYKRKQHFYQDLFATSICV